MAKTLTRKILEAHLVSGRLVPGEEIGVSVDQVLLQDATGVSALLAFEALGVDRVKAPLAVQYVDHNLLQTDARNADDHRYLRTASARYGLHYSRPGNGVSHQVHLERFSAPGKILLGADSHTPVAGGVGMLGLATGGLDAAFALAGRPYYLACPKVFGVRLYGTLPDWVSAKDVMLELLRRYGVYGCAGKVIEYYGPGVATLSATDRATIAGMGVEAGAVSSVFPSDDRTRAFLVAQGRVDAWVPLEADRGADYDESTEIDLAALEPLIACPSSPGNVVPVREVAGLEVDQVVIGSGLNSSYRDLMVVAKILEGRHTHSHTALHINPASQQVLENVTAKGAMLSLLRSGGRIEQSGCLGCIGMGQAPGTGQVSLRTCPRNFPGVAGARNEEHVYLGSPETAAAAALTGLITDPRDLGRQMPYPRIEEPDAYIIDEASIVHPSPAIRETRVLRGPNMSPVPEFAPVPHALTATVVAKLGDDITGEAILPPDNDTQALQANVAALSAFALRTLVPDFAKRCGEAGGAIVVAGENFGGSSSREQAAAVLRQLGVNVTLARSYGRVFRANLCNVGVVPLVLRNPADHRRIEEGAHVSLRDLRARLERGEREFPLEVNGLSVKALLDVSDRERRYLLAGGALNLTREEHAY